MPPGKQGISKEASAAARLSIVGKSRLIRSAHSNRFSRTNIWKKRRRPIIEVCRNPLSEPSGKRHHSTTYADAFGKMEVGSKGVGGEVAGAGRRDKAADKATEGAKAADGPDWASA